MTEVTKQDETPFTKEDLEALDKQIKEAEESLKKQSAPPEPKQLDEKKLKEDLRAEILADLKKQEEEKAQEAAKKAADEERERLAKNYEQLKEKLDSISSSQAVVKTENPFSQDSAVKKPTLAEVKQRERELLDAMLKHRPM